MNLVKVIEPKFIIDKKVIDPILNKLTEYSMHSWLDSEGNETRKTANFGYNFVEMEKGHVERLKMPQEILDIRAEIFSKIRPLYPFVESEDFFDNVILTHYEAGQYLEPHVDVVANAPHKAHRIFYFDDVIVGVVLEPDSESKLSFKSHQGEEKPSMDAPSNLVVAEEKGALFIIDKPLRTYPYFHFIPPVKNKRVSITLRHVIFK